MAGIMGRISIFHRITGLLLGCFLIGSILFMGKIQRVRELSHRAERLKARLHSLHSSRQIPAEHQVRQLKLDLGKIRDRIHSHTKFFSSEDPIRTSSDAMVVMPRVQSLILETRRDYRRQGIKIVEDEAFGFSRYQVEGDPPPDAAVPILDKQIAIMRHLLALLSESNPFSLVRVERENVERGHPSRKSEALASRRYTGKDYFSIDSRASARVSGLVNTLAFRITFTGYTEALRNFLNRLGHFEQPLLVREVEARLAEYTPFGPPLDNTSFSELFEGPHSSVPQGSPVGPAQEPVIENNLSEFRVVLEYVELNIHNQIKGDVKTKTDGEEKFDYWNSPQSQGEDPLWVYDVFTPPRIYIHPETRLFSVIPHIKKAEATPFELVFRGIERPFYRLHFEGYIEESASDPRITLIRIYDRERDKLELFRVGEESRDGQFRIRDFQLTRQIDERGLVESEAVAEIVDLREGRSFNLKLGEEHRRETYRVFLSEESNREQIHVVEGPGGRMEYGESIYTILEIDGEGESILLERIDARGNRHVKEIVKGFGQNKLGETIIQGRTQERGTR